MTLSKKIVTIGNIDETFKFYLKEDVEECFKEILEKLKKLWMKENSYLIFSDIEEIIKKLSGFKE